MGRGAQESSLELAGLWEGPPRTVRCPWLHPKASSILWAQRASLYEKGAPWGAALSGMGFKGPGSPPALLAVRCSPQPPSARPTALGGGGRATPAHAASEPQPLNSFLTRTSDDRNQRWEPHEPLTTPSLPRTPGAGFPSSGGTGGRISGQARGRGGGWRSPPFGAVPPPRRRIYRRRRNLLPRPGARRRPRGHENQASAKKKGEAESLRVDARAWGGQRVPLCI